MSTLPYGVLAPLLSDVDEERLCTPLAVLRSVLAALRARSEGHRCVVVVDDVHLLDRESNHLLAQLVMSGAVHLLGFARSAADDLMDLGSLVDDAVLARFELAPLTPDDVAATCRHLLGGGIVRGASDYFTEKSGGNPLFLRSIVLHAVRSRCLVLSDGIYVLLNEPDEVDPALADLVAGDLRDVPALERDALDALSLAGAVPFILLSAMAGDAAVRRLLTSGLVRAAPWDPALAVVDPPMYAAVLSSLVTVGRRADLRARLLPVGTEFPPFGRGRISQLEWALDCGESVDDRVLLEAARVACTESTPQVALRLAEAVRSSGHAVAAAVEATRARSLLRRTTPAAAGV